MKPMLIFLLVAVLGSTAPTLCGANHKGAVRKPVKKERLLPLTDAGRALNNESSFLVVCGGAKTVLSPKDLIKGYDLSRLIEGIHIPVKLYLGRKGILIDAKLHNTKDHHLVTIIKRNKVQDLPPGYDVNFSPSAFEMIDNTGQPLLQVQIRHRNEIHVGGCFRRRKNRISVTPDCTLLSSRECDGTTLFKYPGSKYPGQLKLVARDRKPESSIRDLPKEKLIQFTDSLLEKLGGLTCLDSNTRQPHGESRDTLAIENDRLDTYRREYSGDALRIRAELLERTKNKNIAWLTSNEFEFREPVGFFGLAEIGFALRYLKNTYVSDYSALADKEIIHLAADYVRSLELLLRPNKIGDIDLCRYDRESKVEGIFLLEEISRRLPGDQKPDHQVEFLILTKWTVNHFQILEMQKTMRLYKKKLSQTRSPKGGS